MFGISKFFTGPGGKVFVTVGAVTDYDLNADLQANYNWDGAESRKVDVYLTGALDGDNPFSTGADATVGSLTVRIFNQSTSRAAGGDWPRGRGRDAWTISYDIEYDNELGEIAGGGDSGTTGVTIPASPGGPKEPPDPAIPGGGGGGGAGTPFGLGGAGNGPGANGTATAGGAGGTGPGNAGTPGGGRGSNGKAIELNGHTATDIGVSAGTIFGAIS